MSDVLAARPTELLTPDFLRKLEQLRLVSRRAFIGRTWGERRSRKRGASVEFADFRNYAHGDDLRHLDWNAFARLDRLFLKLFVEEEDLSVYVLVDASRSMGIRRNSITLAERQGRSRTWRSATLTVSPSGHTASVFGTSSGRLAAGPRHCPACAGSQVSRLTAGHPLVQLCESSLCERAAPALP